MAYTNTTLLGLNQPTTGSEPGVWGDDINLGTTILVELAVAGTNNITSDADVTLTVSNGSSGSSFTSTATNSTVAQYYILNLSGSRAAARSITAPTSSRSFLVTNGTTGGYAITIKKSGGTGVSVAAGETCIVYYNTVTADYAKAVSTVVTGVVATANGGTGTASSVSTIAAFNNSAPGYTTVTAAGTTTTLTAASTYFQKINGSTTQTFQLPDATTLLNGTAFVFDNDSTGNVTIVDNASGAVSTVYPGNFQYIFVESNSTAAGSWGKYAFIPAATYVPSGSTGALATTGKAIAMALVFGF